MFDQGWDRHLAARHMTFLALTIDSRSIHEVRESVSVLFVNGVTVDAARSLGRVVTRSAVIGVESPARSGRMSVARMTTQAGLRRECKGHPVRLFERTDRVANAVPRGEQLDRSALEQPQSRVAVDAAEGHVLTVLHPAATVHLCEKMRG